VACIIVAVKKRKRVTINISAEAKMELDSVKSLGQSYDGVIRQLVRFWKEKKGKG